MLKALRLQVQAAFEGLPLQRRPALRRYDGAGALFCTDLPLAAEADAVDLFSGRLKGQGWRVSTSGSWLLLDCDPPTPEVSPCGASGELGCLISLLERHPQPAADAEALRQLLKAAEAGALSPLCRALHDDWAQRLRRHEPLPAGLLPYLYHIAKEASVC